ncbi:MAG TPA: 50S ribosomal protein L10 [Gemmataceae bacterium]|nr:50S ribosomal protein L10 [Gemmataceae bacterium]
MSKQIKQMEMDALNQTFKGVRDVVALTVTGLNATTDNHLRLALRKKNIRLQVVKNSLARKVFTAMGLNATGFWEGPTTIAWGAGSIAELARELQTVQQKNEKVMKFKGAIADGEEITIEAALRRPTRPEALGRVIGLALAPASRLASQILGPAAHVAGQIKTLREKKEEAAAEPAAPTA